MTDPQAHIQTQAELDELAAFKRLEGFLEDFEPPEEDMSTRKEIEAHIRDRVAKDPELILNPPAVAVALAEKFDADAKRAQVIVQQVFEEIRAHWTEKNCVTTNTRPFKLQLLRNWIVRNVEAELPPPTTPTIDARFKEVFGSGCSSNLSADLRRQLEKEGLKVRSAQTPAKSCQPEPSSPRPPAADPDSSYVFEAVRLVDQAEHEKLWLVLQSCKAAGVPVPAKVKNYFKSREATRKAQPQVVARFPLKDNEPVPFNKQWLKGATHVRLVVGK